MTCENVRTKLLSFPAPRGGGSKFHQNALGIDDVINNFIKERGKMIDHIIDIKFAYTLLQGVEQDPMNPKRPKVVFQSNETALVIYEIAGE